MDNERSIRPHILIFPLPLQSHVTTTLKFAELLCLANFHVTFLNSHFVHNRLLRHTDIQSHFTCYPGFRFKTITDGLPENHPRSGGRMLEMFDSLRSVTKPLFREMVVSGGHDLGLDSSWPPITCIVADGIMSFAIDVAKEIGVMGISFRTINASCYWTYFCMPKLIEAKELPFKESEDMDRLVTCVPVMEGYLRRRDLPGFCRTSNVGDKTLQYVIRESQDNARADALIINTFEELEAPILSRIRTNIPNTYAIGPLHTHLCARLASMEAAAPIASNSLWEEDRGCIAWMDAQPPKSVLYVSFGSIAVMTRNELMEFWYGLVNSGKRFLWVMRPDSVVGEGGGQGEVPAELVAGTRERGYMVGWSPQEEVLSHEAIGGFFTHSGWNSILESIVAGVPMICWAYFADQMVNSRLVNEVWKLGFDMKDRCDRVIIEKMIRDLMGERKEEFMRSATEMAKLARASVSEGGSSSCSLDRLIEDIRRRSLHRASNC